MPVTKTRLTVEQIDLLTPIIGEVQPEDLAENRSKYDKWMSRYPGFELIFRHQRRAADPATGDIMFLGGRKIKFVKGVAYLPREDPEYDRMLVILERASDVIAGNTFSVDAKMKEGLIEDESDVDQSTINQRDDIPLLKLGINPSQVPAIQKVLDRRRRIRDAVANKRLAELEAENKRLKAVAKGKGKPTKANATPPANSDGSAEGEPKDDSL